MKTSARNQFLCTVSGIERGAVYAKVLLQVSPDVTLNAVVTLEAIDDMAFSVGSNVHALIKVGTPILLNDTTEVAASSANRLRGTVVDCQSGAVNGMVKIDLGQGKILTTVITNSAIAELDIKIGKRLIALINESSIILAC